MKSILKIAPVLALVLAVSGHATSRDEGIYCVYNQTSLFNAIRVINSKIDNEDNFTVPLSPALSGGQSSHVIEDARLRGVAIDSYTITKWKYSPILLAKFGKFTKVKFPYWKPTYARRYNVCVALRED